MADPAPTGRAKWFWIIIILLLLVVLVVWLWKPSGNMDSVVTAPEPTGQSTDWTVEPEGPSVPVTVPTSL